MKRWIAAAVAIPAAVAVVVPFALVGATVNAALSISINNNTGCAPDATAAVVAAPVGAAPSSSKKWTADQLGIAKTAIGVGKAHGIPERGWVVVLAAGLVESELRNLTYGDRDSRGWLQQRPSSGWGTIEQIQDPALAAAAFYGVAKHTHNRGLVDVFDWQRKPVGDVADSVQVSAHPERYGKREADARALVAMLGGTPGVPVTPPADCTQGSVGAGNLTARVATWNVLKSNSAGNVARGFGALAARVDVIGAQELGRERLRATAAYAAHGMAMVDENSAVPIFYSASKYRLLGSHKVVAFGPGQHVEPSHGDHGRAGPKNIIWVHLEDRVNHARFYVLNTHMLVGWQHHPRRNALYGRQLQALLALSDRFAAFAASGEPVLITGDFNRSHLPEMGRHHLASSLTKATHGHKTLDRIWSAVAAPVSHTILDKFGSDHSPVVATFVAKASEVVGGTRAVRSEGRLFRIPIPQGKTGVAINYALDQLGDRYVWGAHGPDAWDCSGLTGGAWIHAGISVPQQSDSQEATLRHVPLSQMRPGDITWHPGHVQLYLGVIDGQQTVIEAPNPRRPVRIDQTGWMNIQAVLRPWG